MKYNILKRSAIALCLGALSVATLSTSCENTYSNDPLTEVILISTVGVNVDLDLKLAYGMTKQLEWSVLPENSTSKDVAFASSDDEVVTVTEDGLLEAVGYGTANISISQASLYNTLTSIKITVVSAATAISVPDISIFETASITVSDYVTATPSTAYNVVDCTVADTSIAEFDNGVITGLVAGTTTVSYASIDGSNLSGTFSLTVKEPIKLTSIAVTDPLHHIMIGSSKSLKTTLLPDEASSDLLAWKSSNESVMTVDAAGRVTAVAEGSATITAYDALQGEDVVKDELVMTVAPAGTLCLDFDEISSYDELKALGLTYADSKTMTVSGADGYAELYGDSSTNSMPIYITYPLVNNLTSYPYFAMKIDLSPDSQTAGNLDNITFENLIKTDNVYYGGSLYSHSDYMFYSSDTAPQVLSYDYTSDVFTTAAGGGFPDNSQTLTNWKFKFAGITDETHINIYWMYHFPSKEAFNAFMAANEEPTNK